MTRKRYPEIADDLRIRILSGELTPGSQLPTQVELMAEYKTTLMTIRRAIDELAKEGLVASKDKIGVFVRDRRRYRLEINRTGPQGFSPSFPSLASRLLTGMASPDRALSQTVAIRQAVPGPEVVERLRLTDRRTLLRHSVFYAGQEPVSFANGHFPAQMVAGSDLELPEPLDSIFVVLDGLQLNPYELVNEFIIRNATPAERAEMHWPSSMSVLVQVCTTYTEAGLPVYYWESVLPGDRLLLAERQYRDAPTEVRAAG